MRRRSKLQLIVALACSTLLLLGATSVRLAAQGATATILGTVTDSSGGVVPNAKISVTNTGTNAIRTATSDDRGRFNLPELPVGTYNISAEAAGFQTTIQQGVALSPGASQIVDFALAVGQVSQTVTVESNVSQVETTSAAISTVVEQVQIRDLPLNGRNFSELVLSAPGATQNLGAGFTKSAFAGNGVMISVSGSRIAGQGQLLDGTDIQNYQNLGSVSGILGTSIGVDAIAEFTLMTNTYSARYGGNGSVMNSVTRSGTNDLHGSAYEFIRNSAFDAKTFPDTVRQPFHKNQFGVTLGGPIVKDKMFFFANYEGIRQNTGLSKINTVPDVYVMQGYLPRPINADGTLGNQPTNCDGLIAAGIPAGYKNCGSNSSNSTLFNLIKPYLIQYPNTTDAARVFRGANPTGTASITNTAPSPGSENYVMGRYDWTVSDKDSIFARYVIDNADLIEPFYGSFSQWPETDTNRNQYLTLGEKHIVSTNVINSVNAGFTRTFLFFHGQSLNPVQPGQTSVPSGSLNFRGDLDSPLGIPVGDQSLGITGLSSLGGGAINPIRVAQNKFSVGDDVFWNRGAHSISFGGSVTRVETNKVHAVLGGTWTFGTLTNFLTDTPSTYQGPCNFSNGLEPACVFPGTNTPYPNSSPAHDWRDTQFAVYIQDDWKVLPTLTMNLGLRYAPESNPTDAFNNLYRLLPYPDSVSNSTLTPGTAPYLPGTLVPSVLTPVPSVFLRNPSANLDPRIGLAWDPFKDHKTSIRAGYGIFHAVLQNRDYSYFAHFAYPWIVINNNYNGLAAGAAKFPNPFQLGVGTPGLPSTLFSSDPYSSTPYMQQWNLTVQREVVKNTVVTLSYVGSHGVHMITQQSVNQPIGTGGVDLTGAGGATLTLNQKLWPSFPGQTASLVCQAGQSCSAPDPTTGAITCLSAKCNLVGPGNQPVIDPATKQFATARIVQTGATFAVSTNGHLNPNFGFQNTGRTNTYSLYNALQASVVKRMSNNFSLQGSYTYSSCIDLNSGNWSQEGGSMSPDPWDLTRGRGPCMFMIRHNFSTNGLYTLPFKGNRLVAGWQLGGIFYFSTGGPISVSLPAALTRDNGQSSPTYNPPNYVATQAGCNGKPINENPVLTASGVGYLNFNCFVAPPVGEVGNLARNSYFGPNQANVNMNLTKNTQLTERFNLQFRWEVFNAFNRRNIYITSYPGFNQGINTSAAAVGSITDNGTFGQLTQASGSGRQMQFGLKLLF